MLRCKRILKQLNQRSLQILIDSRNEKVRAIKRSCTMRSIKKISKFEIPKE